MEMWRNLLERASVETFCCFKFCWIVCRVGVTGGKGEKWTNFDKKLCLNHKKTIEDLKQIHNSEYLLKLTP